MISPLFVKAGIPSRSVIKILNLVDENKKLRAISVKQRETAATKLRVKRAEEELQRTFVLWPPNPWPLTKKKADREFLQSMMTDRVATMGGLDQVETQQEERPQELLELDRSGLL